MCQPVVAEDCTDIINHHCNSETERLLYSLSFDYKWTWKICKSLKKRPSRYNYSLSFTEYLTPVPSQAPEITSMCESWTERQISAGSLCLKALGSLVKIPESQCKMASLWVRSTRAPWMNFLLEVWAFDLRFLQPGYESDFIHPSIWGRDPPLLVLQLPGSTDPLLQLSFLHSII